MLQISYYIQIMDKSYCMGRERLWGEERKKERADCEAK